LVALALVGIGFFLGRFTANRGVFRDDMQAGAEAPLGEASTLAPGAPLEPASGDGAPAPALATLATDALDSADLPVEPQEPPELAIASEHAGPVAIVIDDLGRSVEVIDELRAFGVPLTYSVLPFEPRTAAVAARLVELGEEVLCHLPMEAQRGENPGPGALTEAMSEGEIRDATRRALESVPGAVGVNNHMGSALSEDPGAMGAMLGVVRKRGLFFLDSRTSAASVAYGLAREAGVPAAERKVFLDVDRTPEAIRHEFARLIALANQGQPAIAIGHPYPETLAVLREELPRALEHGYRFVKVSDVLVGSEGAGGSAR
jgi:hypothetical protein